MLQPRCKVDTQTGSALTVIDFGVRAHARCALPRRWGIDRQQRRLNGRRQSAAGRRSVSPPCPSSRWTELRQQRFLSPCGVHCSAAEEPSHKVETVNDRAGGCFSVKLEHRRLQCFRGRELLN